MKNSALPTARPGFITDFSQRTVEGAGALWASLNNGFEEPERFVYFAGGESTMWARLFGWQRLYEVVNPTLLPLLAGSLARRPETAPVLVPALLAGAVGQVAKNRRPLDPPALGVAAVAANHAGYAYQLYKAGARPTVTSAGLRMVVVGAGGILAALKSPRHLPAVLVGGAAVAASSALAADARLRQPDFHAAHTPAEPDQSAVTARKGLSHGANLLLISEGLTFVKTLIKGKKLGRMAGAAEAATHAVGHVLVVDGLTR